MLTTKNKIRVQNYLHELILNMTQTEKRYFKLVAKQQTPGKKNDCLVLFEAIEKQKKYDEEKLKDSFAGTPLAKRFSSLKKYLYEMVLKTLATYNSETIVTLKIRKMLDASEVLFQKGLFHQSLRKLAKADELADSVGEYFLLGDIRFLRRKCLSQIANVQDELEATDASIEIAIELATESHKLESDNAILFEEVEADKLSSAFLNYRELDKASKNLPNQIPQHKLAIEQQKLALFDNQLLQATLLPNEYLTTLNTIIALNFQVENYEEIERLTAVYNEFINQSHLPLYRKSDYVATLANWRMVGAFINTKKGLKDTVFVESTDLIENKRAKLDKHIKKDLYQNLAWFALWKGELKKAANLNNEANLALANKEVDFNLIIQSILIQWEMKNFSFLEFALQNLKKVKEIEQFTSNQKMVIEFFFENIKQLTSVKANSGILFYQLNKRLEGAVFSCKHYQCMVFKQWVKQKAMALTSTTTSVAK